VYFRGDFILWRSYGATFVDVSIDKLALHYRLEVGLNTALPNTVSDDGIGSRIGN